MPGAGKPIGIYVRVSSKGDRADEQFHSPREQRERAEALARAKGYAAGPLFEDIDVSGAKAPADRPAMGLLLRAIEAGELGGIAAFSLDRLSREPAHGDWLVKAVTKAGGVILTPDIPDAIDTPTGEFTFGMLLQVAKLYRSQAGARFASAKERSILAGIPVGKTAVGYRQLPDRRLEVDPATAPTVRAIFERRAAGASLGQLTSLLDNVTGRVWSHNGVRKLLTNRMYATGRLELNGLISEHDAGAIVDEPLWHAAQVSGASRPKRAGESEWTLTGLARCAGCGLRLSPSRTKKRDVEHRYYRCRNRACLERAGVPAAKLERFVYYRTVQLDNELTTRADSPDLGAFEDALTAAERRLTQALSPEAQDALGDAWASTVRTRRQERDAAGAALGAARQAAGVMARTFHLEDAWEGMDTADRRAALALFWKAVYVGRPDAGTRGGPRALRFVTRGPHSEIEVELLGNGD